MSVKVIDTASNIAKDLGVSSAYVRRIIKMRSIDSVGIDHNHNSGGKKPNLYKYDDVKKAIESVHGYGKAECENCKEVFAKNSHNQKYCQKDECIKAKIQKHRRSRLSKANEYNKKRYWENHDAERERRRKYGNERYAKNIEENRAKSVENYHLKVKNNPKHKEYVKKVLLEQKQTNDKSAEVSRTHGIYHSRWEDSEIKTLISMRIDGFSFDDIAKKLKRSEKATARKFWKLKNRDKEIYNKIKKRFEEV